MTSDVIFIHRQVSKVFRFDGSDGNDIYAGGDCGDDMCGSCGDNGTRCRVWSALCSIGGGNCLQSGSDGDRGGGGGRDGDCGTRWRA